MATQFEQPLDFQRLRELKMIATQMRIDIVTMVHDAKSGHPGGSLDLCELFAYLYYNRMNIDPTNPEMPTRDRLVLSKGHCSPVYYSALGRRGYFDVQEFKYFRKINHILQGHPDKKHIPGVDMSSGSLGQGFSVACGMAIAGKRENKNYKVYAVVGDGELQEGQNWEAAMFASHYKLDNLCVFVDYNNLQITDSVDKVMGLESLTAKFSAFGFNVVEIDGDDFEQIRDALANFDNTTGKPTAVIMRTHKGQGVSFMQDNVYWHGNPPKDDQYEQAMKELNATMASLEVQNG